MQLKRLEQQMLFIREIDHLKGVLRRSYLLAGERNENSAEHSWHVATMALLLSEYADQSIDLMRVIKMLLIHDIVEIDAGDTFVYDQEASVEQADRERCAADRIFGLLPKDQEDEFRALWNEFEEASTPSAIFAKSLDRMIPIMHNFYTNGKSWKEHGVRKQQVIDMNKRILQGSKRLWEYALLLIEEAEEKGYFQEDIRERG